MEKKLKFRIGLGASSSIDDQQIERYHQKYQDVMSGLKAGKYNDEKIAGENWDAPCSFAGKNRDAFARLIIEALDSSPLKKTRKSRDFTVNDMTYE